ncbi:ClbS/DfsB family four-helix bundle protein, partial [Candidatus Saccharibacteria bacterium]|nr:ClbS/DfsB family four-helix bundle protein [Candidatus Saccharibacteria bacterium]
MARPKTKSELLDASVAAFDKLIAMVNATPSDATFDLSGAGREAHWSRDKNTRDILVHIYEWHQLLLNWIA